MFQSQGHETMNKDTWGSRGWCLAEHMAGELCGVNEKAALVAMGHRATAQELSHVTGEKGMIKVEASIPSILEARA